MKELLSEKWIRILVLVCVFITSGCNGPNKDEVCLTPEDISGDDISGEDISGDELLEDDESEVGEGEDATVETVNLGTGDVVVTEVDSNSSAQKGPENCAVSPLSDLYSSESTEEGNLEDNEEDVISEKTLDVLVESGRFDVETQPRLSFIELQAYEVLDDQAQLYTNVNNGEFYINFNATFDNEVYEHSEEEYYAVLNIHPLDAHDMFGTGLNLGQNQIIQPINGDAIRSKCVYGQNFSITCSINDGDEFNLDVGDKFESLPSSVFVNVFICSPDQCYLNAGSAKIQLN